MARAPRRRSPQPNRRARFTNILVADVPHDLELLFADPLDFEERIVAALKLPRDLRLFHLPESLNLEPRAQHCHFARLGPVPPPQPHMVMQPKQQPQHHGSVDDEAEKS
jgi:hypothetical protein